MKHFLIYIYPQKPLVTTRYKKYTDVDKLPYGINAIVAIACYSGYNQEDAVILNETSVERGLYNSLYLRSYKDSEENENGKKIYFANFIESNTMIKKISTYEKLDDHGFIKENTYVTPDDTIVGKCYKSVNKNGKEITNCFGSSIKFGDTSGIVDKVVVTKNREGMRNCKVRIRKVKMPGIGDKFTSRCGQKGMCGGIKQEDMPFTKEGIVPDAIINPHAIPSRMTINQFLEVILGKSCCMSGHLYACYTISK